MAAAERLQSPERLLHTSSDRPAMRVGPIPFRICRSAAGGSTCTCTSGVSYEGAATGICDHRAAAFTGGSDGGSSGSGFNPASRGPREHPNAVGRQDAAGDGEKSSGGTPCASVSDDLLRMFQESVLCDVEVICTAGTGCVFRAHRVILAARSPVFKAMFLTGMREKRHGKVVIEDVVPEAIKCMLDFAYKDECPDLDEDRIFDVLKIANKYDMPGLRDICLDFMAKNSRSDNSVGFLAACDSYNLHEFKHMLLSALVDNPPALHECVNSQGMDAYPELMKQLLTLCAHRLSQTKERHVVKHFDGLPYRSRCYVCANEVANMSKQMLGEMLFPMIQKIVPEHANKITGMIIELDNVELLPLFESERALREKVAEALAVLKAAQEEPEPVQRETGTPRGR